MAFDQSTITDLQVARAGADLALSWSSSAPTGTVFQAYLAHKLAWSGTSRSCLLPWPSTDGMGTAIDVGTVDADEGATDFSGSLPSTPSTRVTLAWPGGTYLSPTLAGFHVYQSTTAGGAVSYAAPIDTVPAYPGGLILDGFGLGGFGDGGFGFAASSYSYTTTPLGNGTWTFAVVPFDAAGNTAGTPLTQTAAIAAPPQPPAADSLGRRLVYSYNGTTHAATLTWLASPG